MEFYIWDEAIERWNNEGLPDDYLAVNLFNFDPPPITITVMDLGWCEPPFIPFYEEEVVKSEGDTEIIRDWAGRLLRVFKGRRHGFMPEYIKHPVTDRTDWEEDVMPRLDPANPQRYEDLDLLCEQTARLRDSEGTMVRQGIIGGYMYLRALMGPVDLLYAFHEKADLIHDMMRQWALLMNTALEKVQDHIVLDDLALAEDICYNHGLLISPDMVREFLVPYYQDVVGNVRQRQEQKLYFSVDSDGWVEPAIPLYVEAGMDVMSPFEVASGCDVVDIGKKFPNLVISGGIDKRVLAQDKEAIERHLEYIIPAMLERGGYVPTCDHGVPDNVSLENYLHYRTRVCELDH